MIFNLLNKMLKESSCFFFVLFLKDGVTGRVLKTVQEHKNCRIY